MDDEKDPEGHPRGVDVPPFDAEDRIAGLAARVEAVSQSVELVQKSAADVLERTKRRLTIPEFIVLGVLGAVGYQAYDQRATKQDIEKELESLRNVRDVAKAEQQRVETEATTITTGFCALAKSTALLLDGYRDLQKKYYASVDDDGEKACQALDAWKLSLDISNVTSTSSGAGQQLRSGLTDMYVACKVLLARSAFQQHNWESMIQIGRKIVDIAPDRYEGHHYIGTGALQQFDTDLAVKELSKSVELRQNQNIDYLNLVELSCLRGHFDAVDEYVRAFRGRFQTEDVVLPFVADFYETLREFVNDESNAEKRFEGFWTLHAGVDTKKSTSFDVGVARAILDCIQQSEGKPTDWWGKTKPENRASAIKFVDTFVQKFASSNKS